MIRYPFAPKSNKFLRPGQFFAVPLSDGRYAAGRVMDVPAFGPNDHVGMVAGLMDWIGGRSPTAADLAGRKVVAQGKTGFRAIVNTGGELLGERDLRLDGLAPMDPYGDRVTVWGDHAIRLRAEEILVGHPERTFRFFIDFPTQRRARHALSALATPSQLRELDGAWRVAATAVARLPIELACERFKSYAKMLGGAYAGCELAPVPQTEE